MWNETEICRRLGLRYPIIQGPFGGGLSTVKLVAAVSNAGGLGSYGAHGLSPAEIIALAADIRKATDRPFALNLWVSGVDPGGEDLGTEARSQAEKIFRPIYEELGIPLPAAYQADDFTFEEQAAALLEARPAVFSFVFGIPNTDILKECRRLGITTIGAATTVAEARAIESAGVDLVLATGFEAGGHRPSFLRPAEESLMGTFALVPQVADSVKTPVIAAGGIADARGIAAACALGAQAAQLGTAFLACEESGASPAHRGLLHGRGEDFCTRLSRVFTGRLARYIPNHVLKWMEDQPGRPLPYPLQSWFTGPIRRHAAKRQLGEYLALYAGQATPLIKHRRAAELMTQLVDGLNKSS
jgi:nitronate monooxygenase